MAPPGRKRLLARVGHRLRKKALRTVVALVARKDTGMKHAILALALSVSPASAQMFCGGTADMIAGLATGFGEVRLNECALVLVVLQLRAVNLYGTRKSANVLEQGLTSNRGSRMLKHQGHVNQIFDC